VRAYYGANWTSAASNQATATVAAAPITYVQAITGGGTASPFSATLTTTPVAGNLLVAVAATRNSGTLSAPAGWSTAINQTGTPSQAVFYKVAGAAESRTVSVSTTATGNGNGLQVLEYSGVSTLHLTGSSTATSGATISSGSVTTTTGRALLVAGVVTQAGTAFTAVPTNSFTGRNGFTHGTGGSTTLFGAADRIVNTTGTYTTSSTSNASGRWRGQIVAFL
jgi:hypothetical protein